MQQFCFIHRFSSEFGLKAKATCKYKGHASEDVVLSNKEHNYTPILNVDGLQITKCSTSGKVGKE